MVEEQDRFYLKAKDYHEDVAEVLGIIVDYQRDLTHLCAADKNRVRTEPLFKKYDAKQAPHPHNNWPGRYGNRAIGVLSGITS